MDDEFALDLPQLLPLETWDNCYQIGLWPVEDRRPNLLNPDAVPLAIEVPAECVHCRSTAMIHSATGKPHNPGGTMKPGRLKRHKETSFDYAFLLDLVGIGE